MSYQVDVPLYVDVDGTLLKTDLLYESFLVSVKRNPLIIFYSFFWLLQGIQVLKGELASRADLNLKIMPKNLEFWQFLEQQRNVGRKIVLATASHEKYAKKLLNLYPMFDGYICSTDKQNLKGSVKLEEILKRSGVFAYAGNDNVDFIIFERASESYLVNPSNKAKVLSKDFNFKAIYDETTTSFKDWVKQLRVYQWVKNLLVFVPLVVSGSFLNLNQINDSIAAFIAFSLLASATYILNDLFDLESDRLHKRKKERPLAAGKISILKAVTVGSALLSLAIFIAINISASYLFVLFGYLLLTLAYSFVIKQYVGMDTVCLAMLYTVRIFAGAVAIDVEVSFWLLAFSIFTFLSLALVKRCSEIRMMETDGKERASGRDYTIIDFSVLQSFGCSSAMLSVLMLCFYINNNVLVDQYHQPTILWLLVPVLSYWLMRMWIKTNRTEMHDDPIVFALKDRGSLITISFCLIITIVAQIL